MEDTLDRLGASIKVGLPASVTGHSVANGELTVFAKAADVVKVVTFLRDDPACQFVCIIDVTALDWPGRERRFRPNAGPNRLGEQPAFVEQLQQRDAA